nr:helix-turn-helix domain-containing protein [Shewanella sp.]
MNLHDQIIGSQESSVFLLIICVEETALQLLRQGLAIKEVALTLGYNQTSPYIVMFKKYAQCSPEQYRRRL